jgi:hypothetical protein
MKISSLKKRFKRRVIVTIYFCTNSNIKMNFFVFSVGVYEGGE